jgi:hypothetical protein
LTAISIPVFVDDSDGIVLIRRSDGRWKISTPPESKALGTANNVFSGFAEDGDGETGRPSALTNTIENAQKLSAFTGMECSSHG